MPTEVQKMIAQEKLTMSHAKILSKLDSEAEIIDMAHKIIEGHMPVHDLENATITAPKKNKIERKVKSQNAEFKYVEDMLRDKLDTRVKINDKKIVISFTNVADLNRILEILDVKE